MFNSNDLENFTNQDLSHRLNVDNLDSNIMSDIADSEQLSIKDFVSIDDPEEMKNQIDNILNNLDISGEKSHKMVDFFHTLAFISARGEITYNVEKLDNEIVNFILNAGISSYNVEGFQPLDETLEGPSMEAFGAFKFFHLFAISLCELDPTSSTILYLHRQFLTLKDSFEVTNLNTVVKYGVSAYHMTNNPKTLHKRFCDTTFKSFNKLNLNEEKIRKIRFWFEQTASKKSCFASYLNNKDPFATYKTLTDTGLNFDSVRTCFKEELSLNKETFDKLNRLLFYFIFFDKLVYFMVF